MIALILSFLRSINPRILLGIALCIAALYGWHRLTGHYIEIGRKEVRTKWTIEKAEFEEKAKDARIAEQQKQATINESIKKGHANEIAKIHASYATVNRLRIPSSACNKFASTAEATSTGRNDAAPSRTIALPESIERDLYALAQEADTMLANYRALQEFIKQNGLAQ